MRSQEFHPGQLVKVKVPSSPYRGRVGRLEKCTSSGKQATVDLGGTIGIRRFWTTSLEPVASSARPKGGPRSKAGDPPAQRGVEEALVDLVDQVARLVRITADRIEESGARERRE